MFRRTARARLLLIVVAVAAFVVLPSSAAVAVDAPVPPAGPQAPGGPTAPTAPSAPAFDGSTGVFVTLDDSAGSLSRSVTTVMLMTLAAVAPLLLLLMTTFTRFVVVMGLARTGLGLQTVPPAQVLVGLAFFLTLFSMAPTMSVLNETAIQPVLAGEMDALQAAQVGYEPMREFMLAQTDERDLSMFIDLSPDPAPASVEEIGATTLIPAFVISELRTAFTIGFVVFVPFLIIDLVVAAVLMSMGMVMLPPVFVSLPLKLLLFVLVDGWALLSRSLVGSVV